MSIKIATKNRQYGAKSVARFGKKLTLVFLIFLQACATGKIMTMGEFYNIPIGTSTETIVERFGNPISIKEEENGAVSYYYTERLMNGLRIIEERYYRFVFVRGALAHKSVEQENTPPYKLNSYDLQTTLGEENSTEDNESNKN